MKHKLQLFYAIRSSYALWHTSFDEISPHKMKTKPCTKHAIVKSGLCIQDSFGKGKFFWWFRCGAIAHSLCRGWNVFQCPHRKLESLKGPLSPRQVPSRSRCQKFESCANSSKIRRDTQQKVSVCEYIVARLIQLGVEC